MAVSLSLAITQNSQSIDNNTSNVTVKVNIKWTYGSFNRTDKSGYLIIDGTKYTFTSTFNENESTSGSQTIFTKTVNVPHSSDGSKTLACSASFTSGVSSGTITASASKVLTTIPRKSTLSASNGTLGTAQTLTVSRKSNSFTHTITYKCGSASGTVATKSSSTSISFTPPLSLAAQNTTGTSVSITFTITTYNGDSNIGSNTKTISCAIPASVKPSCTLSVTDAAGYESTYGNPIKGRSKFKVTVTPTIAQGSAIASYSTKANGSTYTAATFTTDVLKSSGTLTISATVKDKRGRSGTAEATKTVLDYSEPIVKALSVIRCNADGSENIQGEYVKAKFTAAITALNNKNKATYKIGYKKTSATTYTETTLTALNDKYSVTDQTYIFPADSGSSYDVRVTATDNFKTISRHTTASTAFTLFHYNASGKGFAFGKLSEFDKLEIALKMWSAFGDIMVSPVELPSNQDLNGLTEPGYYLVGNTTVSPTIKNKPPLITDNGTAFVEVLPMGDGAQRCQRYYQCTKATQFVFQRIYYTSSWGDWMVVSGCTDWRELTIASGFELYASTSQPKYRVNGNNVTVCGAVKPTAIVASGTTDIKIAGTIPEAFRPSYTQPFICQGSGINRWCFSIKTDGNLYVGRYGTNDYVDIPVGAWLIFSATYSI